MAIRSVQISTKQDPDDPNSPTLIAEIDRHSEMLVTLDGVHARIHDGVFFSVGNAQQAVANNANVDLLIQTPVGAPFHVRFSGLTGGAAVNAFYEGTTFSAEGTVVTPINRNRRSANVARGTFTIAPTITDLGTPLFLGYTGGGSGGSASGSATASFEEYILQSSQTYLARITNLAGNNQPITLIMDFYDTGLEAYA